MQIHTEFRENFTVKIPRNSAEFRGIPYVFQKIPYSAGRKISTSVDTLLSALQVQNKPTFRKGNIMGEYKGRAPEFFCCRLT